MIELSEILIFMLSIVVGFLATQLWIVNRKANKFEKYFYLALHQMPYIQERQLINEFNETK
jgi:hypothetical protein